MTALFQPSESDPSKFKYRCSVTHLAPSVILSAAHCHKKRDIAYVGTKLAVLGWGKEGSDVQNTDTLHKAEVELWDLAGCITSYGGDSCGSLPYNNHHGGIAQLCPSPTSRPSHPGPTY
eukprot:15334493-Ditylum_brightwellii.AAC.1